MAHKPGPLAVMGGAFDPVHLGHLRTATELMQVCDLAEVRFVPSANPPHRPPHIAGANLRVQMLEAATADSAVFAVDRRELERSGPSYSHTTFSELRAEQGERSLCMIVGMDAFLGLTKWHRWQELCELAHLLVAHRPGWLLPEVGELGEFFKSRICTDPRVLQQAPAGHLFIHEVTQLEISSSAVRAEVARGGDSRYLVPESVRRLLLDSGCYENRNAVPPQEKSAHA